MEILGNQPNRRPSQRCHSQHLLNPDPGADALLQQRKSLLRTVRQLLGRAADASFDHGLMMGGVARAFEFLDSERYDELSHDPLAGKLEDIREMLDYIRPVLERL